MAKTTQPFLKAVLCGENQWWHRLLIKISLGITLSNHLNFYLWKELLNITENEKT
jgi:hypothetical protein